MWVVDPVARMPIVGLSPGGKPMTSNVTRVDLYETVCQKVGLSRSESLAMVELVLKEITDTLEKGETVKLSSFGRRNCASAATRRPAPRCRFRRAA
jgi:hypothetical protein